MSAMATQQGREREVPISPLPRATEHHPLAPFTRNRHGGAFTGPGGKRRGHFCRPNLAGFARLDRPSRAYASVELGLADIDSDRHFSS